MPELPDVENYKRYLDSTSLHQKIKAVKVHSAKILKGVSQGRLKNQLQGSCLRSTIRYGKYLFVEVEDSLWLALHFGMTGYLKYSKEDSKEERHSRLVFVFQNRYKLEYVCQRQLGKVMVINSIGKFIKDNKLGRDALEVDFANFKRVLQRARGAVKSTLMNQKFLAGIGNIYSDEILFQSGVHPETKGDKLSPVEIRRIYHNMRKVLKRAVERQAEPDRFPKSYLLPHRRKWGNCPRCGELIEWKKVCGRTAYFCPTCQS